MIPDNASAEYKNSLALSQEIRRLRADYEERITVLENRVQMQDASIKQLQQLFATQMVDRGTGPTV